MKKTGVFLVLGFLCVMLIAGCGQRIRIPIDPTLVQQSSAKLTEEAAAKFSLSLVSFAFNSLDPSSPVTVGWKAEGNFPEGFILTWSDDTAYPEPGLNGWAPVNDGEIREVQIMLENKTDHYFRICRVADAQCDGYSESILVEFPEVASLDTEDQSGTKQATKTKEIKATVSGTLTPQTASSVRITEITTDQEGTVHVNWKLDGSAPEGFRVLWSGQDRNPTYPGSTAPLVKDPNARSLAVEGFNREIKYYFRVCVTKDDECVSYSDSWAYRVPAEVTKTPKPSATYAVTKTPTPSIKTLSLMSISDAGDGKAKLVWSASGYFPNGFKIAYSSYNSVPVYPGDEMVYVTSGGARSAIVSGLLPSETYYFRVCDFTGSECISYSNMKTYTVPAYPTKTATIKPTKTNTPTPDGSTIVLNVLSDLGGGSVAVNWVPAGSFPNGYKVVWATTGTPVYPGSDFVAIGTGITSTTVSGLALDKTYTFRVCRFTGSGCDVYSNAQVISLPGPTDTPTPTPTATFTFTPTNTATVTPLPTATPTATPTP